MILDILILVVLLFLSAFFSAAETALVSLSATKVRSLVQSKRPGAKLVAKLKSTPHKLLITILVGNDLVNVGASVYATLVFQQLLKDAALGIITGVLTLVLLVFGDMVPKTFAQTYNKQFSLAFAPFLYFFYILFTPVVWILDLLVKGLLHLSPQEKIELKVTEDELKAFVSIGAEEGSIELQERELIENVLEFTDTVVEAVMVQRVDMRALPIETTLREAASFVNKERHSRIPIYKGSIDNIVGVLTIKDLLQHLNHADMEGPLSKIDLHKPFKVPRSKKINRLFHEFQKRHMHMAIVLDEHGGTAGLATMEDILEEIVGEIADEFDVEEEADFVKVGKTEVQATGKTLIDDINDALDIVIPCQGHKTISYYITEKLGRFPKKGEIIEGKGYTITVDEMHKYAITKVSIEKESDK